NKYGTSIYLRTSPDELAKRLSISKEKRPLIKDKSPEELKIFIADSLEKREPFYNQATHIYDLPPANSPKELETIVNHLIHYLSQKNESTSQRTENS
ncbi:MAG: hypothetical protein LBI65_04325, partial [Candidatus Symbiothrix sp.]|nr:hypothetical protein [Candidatus Symbiothrix sp.]